MKKNVMFHKTIQNFGEILNIDGDAKIWLGFGAVEDYEGEAYEYEGHLFDQLHK